MPLSDWSGEFEPDGVVSTAASSFLDELGTMLDAYRPAKLDRDRSYLRIEDADTVEVRLAHADGEAGDIAVSVSEGEATIACALSHEHVFPHEIDPEDDRPWTTLAVDMVGSILRGDVIFEAVYRGGTWIKTRTILLDAQGNEIVHSESGSLWAWMIRWRPERVVRHRVDFEAASGPWSR